MTQDSQESQVQLAFLDLKEQMDLQVLLVLVEHLVGQEILDNPDFPASLVIKVWLVAMVYQDHQGKRVIQVLQALAAQAHLDSQEYQGLKETLVFQAFLVILDFLVQRVSQDFLVCLANPVL